MPRLVEELLFLRHNHESGAPVPVPDRSVSHALAGALLMDLALEGRIDTDLKHLFVVDSRPLDNPLLDPCLTTITEADDTTDAAFRIERFARPEVADKVRDGGLHRLVEREIPEAAELMTDDGFEAVAAII